MGNMRYGVPYTGSKNKIAAWVVDNLPPARFFIDAFAGGCAVTHAALLSGKYERLIANDLSPAPDLFLDAVHGKFANETRWISREEFFALKATDAYVRYCWSFGALGENYLYARELEPWEKALHWARVYGDLSLFREMGIETDGSRADIIAHKDEYKQTYIRWWLSKQGYTAAELDELIEKCKNSIAHSEEELRGYLRGALKASGLTAAEVDRRLGTQMSGHYFGRSQWEFPTREAYEQMQKFLPLPQGYDEVHGLHQYWEELQKIQSLESLQKIQSLESSQDAARVDRLQELQKAENIDRLSITHSDYQSVFIPEGAVIYCDPPYCGTTNEYGHSVDYESFYEWCERQKNLVVISEYAMPEPRFVSVAQKEKRNTLSQTANKLAIEHLYVPKHQEALYYEMMGKAPADEFYKRMGASE